MQAIDQLIYSNPELFSEDKVRSINRYSDPVWYYKNPVADDPNLLIEIPFREMFSGVPPILEILAKQSLKPNKTKYHPHSATILSDGSLVLRNGSIMGMRQLFSVFISWYKDREFRGPLSDLKHDQFIDLMERYIRTNPEKKQVYRGVRAYRSLEKIVKNLKVLQRCFRSGELIDGLTVTINSNYILDELARKVLSDIHPEYDYLRWKEGTKNDGMPVHKSMALLQNTVEFLRSDETKIYKAIARWTHRGFKSNNGTQFKEGWLLNVTGDDKKQIALLEELFKEFNITNPDELPNSVKSFKINNSLESKEGSAGEYYYYISDITAAALASLTILTGIRAKSEFNAITPSSFERDKDGNYTFKSEIRKTNQGIGACRYIAGIAAEIVDCITELKAVIDPTGKENLFVVSHQKLNVVNGGKKRRPNYAGKHLGDRVMAYINRRYNPFVSEDMRIDSFKPHSLRHAWAEFALRRFEGDSIPELIRQHFRHAYGSYMTDHYMMSKVFEEDGRKIGRNLIGELITKAVDGAERLYGPVGDYIHEMISEFEFIGEDEIEMMVDKFEGLIEPHEYGFCVPRPDTKTLARCYDQKTKLPNTEEACFDKCSGCIHRLSQQVHRDEIMRLGMSIKVSLDSFKKAGLLPLVNVYEGSLKRAVSALKEIDQGSAAHV